MDGPGDYHAKWSKSDRERQISYDITYMWNLKIWHKWTCLHNRNGLPNTGKKVMITKGVSGVGERNWELGINIYTLVYIIIIKQQGPTV